MISFEEFKDLYDSIKGEPEFRIIFLDNDEEYMIIKYDDHVSFQRCGMDDGSEEYDYPDLHILYLSVSVDGICLKDRWDDIELIIVDDSFNLSTPEDLADIYDSLI